MMAYVRDWMMTALVILVLFYLGSPDSAGRIAARAVKAYNIEMQNP
jgi:hypothetical protein